MLKTNLKNEYWAEVIEEGAKVSRNYWAEVIEEGAKVSRNYHVVIVFMWNL